MSGAREHLSLTSLCVIRTTTTTTTTTNVRLVVLVVSGIGFPRTTAAVVVVVISSVLCKRGLVTPLSLSLCLSFVRRETRAFYRSVGRAHAHDRSARMNISHWLSMMNDVLCLR